MEELVKQISSKTGLSPDMARTVVNMVVAYLKKQLPAPVAGQIDAFLKNPSEVSAAENLIGGLASKLTKPKK